MLQTYETELIHIVDANWCCKLGPNARHYLHFFEALRAALQACQLASRVLFPTSLVVAPMTSGAGVKHISSMSMLADGLTSSERDYLQASLAPTSGFLPVIRSYDSAELASFLSTTGSNPPWTSKRLFRLLLRADYDSYGSIAFSKNGRRRLLDCLIDRGLSLNNVPLLKPNSAGLSDRSSEVATGLSADGMTDKELEK
ncbi:unnamed protein product, partial [Protopolystoma xenopodis]